MNKIAQFNQKQVDFYTRTYSSWFNVCEGGKRGGKNVLSVYAFCRALEFHKGKLHLAAGVSISTARLNILDCDGYGLINYFEGRYKEGKYKDRTCLFVETLDGDEKIVLVSGGGKKGDEKLIKGNTYGMAMVTEANECHPDFIREVFDRTLSSSDRKVFHDFNPKAPGHWYYEDVLEFHERKQRDNRNYGYNYEHFTILDNLSISTAKIKERLNTYDRDSVWFLRDILGQRVQAEGLIYPMFNRGFCVVPTAPRAYEKYYISLDYGTQNATAMGLWGLANGIWYLIKEYYHSGRETNNQKTDEEYYAELVNLAGDLPIQQVIIDPSALSFITLIRRKGKFATRKADNAVLDGIRESATALSRGLIKINDCAVNTIREFGLYRWDEKSPEDKPIKENDHAMDGIIRYFCKTLRIAVPKRKSLV